MTGLGSRAPDLPEGAVPRLADTARWIGTWLHRPAFRVRVSGRERVPRTGPVVLVANHSSLLEPQLIYGMLPRRSVFLVKEELFRGVAGRLLRGIGQLPIRRGEADRAPLMAAVRVLRGGGLVGVFPEGTRGTGDVAAAEQGAAWLVRTSGAVVLPVATRGTRRPEGSRRRFRPVVDMLVGEPFALEVGRGRTGLEEATEQIRVRLAGLVHELDEKRRA
ncbi:lysophospholipid acyltransferase family protein [Actinokineospora fastidiosa]|uniref:1-acyl-sn-glycerol-3-phosphate acyltransferase n=1 Tax=Actinokineospora fastidiosa TaxID=1816 RepID=A0A918GSY3_9PSEU|nr:lysophospholipid acyltransferase family protein [Actinokineospora fastidiosa]GGS59308.1 1-acyl-sn-glycerol-3-phosphate acyltransferase [Actinokineospora fastidiosa]